VCVVRCGVVRGRFGFRRRKSGQRERERDSDEDVMRRGAPGQFRESINYHGKDLRVQGSYTDRERDRRGQRPGVRLVGSSRATTEAAINNDERVLA
jgi:hypothetical protein